MDPMITRWGCMTRYTREQIDEVHRLERKRWFRLKEGDGRTMLNALSGSLFLMKIINDSLGPLWPRRTPPEHRGAEIQRFERFIFPKWKKRKENYDKGEGDELSWVHAADFDIFSASFKFRKSGGAGELDRLKKAEPAEPPKWGVEAAVPDD